MKEAYSRIFHVVNLIPKGCVASYGQVADLAGLPGRARMVGKAMGHVPKGMTVNWHRVLRSDGKIAFAPGSEHACRQRDLLQDEQVTVLKNRVAMTEFGWQPDLSVLLHDLDFTKKNNNF